MIMTVKISNDKVDSYKYVRVNIHLVANILKKCILLLWTKISAFVSMLY